MIRKYTVATNVVTVYAGTDGTPGSTGDNNPASKAKLYSPIGIAIDFLGNVYIADTNNYRIRRVDWGPGNNRNITTVAGNGLCCWGGASPQPVFSYMTSDIYGLAVTPYGTLYFPSQTKYSVRAVTVPTSGTSAVDGSCGSCYLPSPGGSLCCQTCAQVIAAQTALKLTYNTNCFAQCNPNGCPATCSVSACAAIPPTLTPTGLYSIIAFIHVSSSQTVFFATLLSCRCVLFSFILASISLQLLPRAMPLVPILCRLIN